MIYFIFWFYLITKYIETLLYELSKLRWFEYFQKVYLFSSKYDKFAPSYTSLIEYPKEDIPDKNRIIEMWDAITKNWENKLHRISVEFQNADADLNSLIGRKSHLSLVDDDLFLLQLACKYVKSWAS